MSDHDHDHHEAPIDPRLAAAASEGCEESRLMISRRALLGMSAAVFSSAFLPRSVEAAGTEQPRLLIALLRGGMDGLHVAPPVGDGRYPDLRGKFAFDRNALLTLDNDFSLHPRLEKFWAMYNAGDASIVHAIAPPLQNRSHFDCLANLENGFPGGRAVRSSTGWLNRLLNELPEGNAIRTAGALEVGQSPLILQGPAPVLSWSRSIFSPRSDPFTSELLKLYQARDPRLHRMLSNGIRTDALANSTLSAAARAPNATGVQQAFRGAGNLLAAEGGPRIAVISATGSWDSHMSQTNMLNALMTHLDNALEDFRLAVGNAWSRTVVICVSEFGRSVKINGSGGTDHGVGTVALLAGGAVKGRKVHHDWPGLANLVINRDLRPTRDTRALFKGVLIEHLGLDRKMLEERVFPLSQGIAPMTGLVKNPATVSAAARI